ncbi:hypothetical protein [Pseudoduganella sp.]|uniref:hypothetical protein n=1 Tax=Pseudoduganella sp. TaxID=1880898 RepID=UPI0035AE1B9D
MAIDRGRAGALALALSLHLAVLAAALAPRYHYAGAPALAADAVAPVLTVRLLAHAGSAPAAPARPLSVPSAPAVAAAARHAPAAAPAAAEAVAEYQAPALASGMEGPQLLLVPGIDAGNLALRLWLGADGAVERVELGQHRYSDADAQRLYETLMQVRFHPARRHGQPVPAELELFVRVVGDLGA